jgi:ATP-dependent DNA helicase RecQ
VLTDYDQTLFEELRALRKRLADVRDVPAFVIFGDVSLRHMAAAIPQSPETFSRVPGVGTAKLEQYGPQFLEVIRSYAEANNLPDRTAELSGRQRPRERDREPERQTPERRRGTTYDTTRELLAQKLSISQIAQQRNLAEPTIIGHLERLTAQGVTLNLEHLLPPPERLNKIRMAFDTCGIDFLAPVMECLGKQATYDELRLARIYLRQEGKEV